jgi:hypothetical protein
MSGLVISPTGLVDAETGLSQGVGMQWETSVGSKAAPSGLRLDFSIALDSEWVVLLPAWPVGASAGITYPGLNFSLAANSQDVFLFPALPV